MKRSRIQNHRSGSIYVAVMGTALIVSLLALSSIAMQRIQNRMLNSSEDIRQAQLNAESAVELGMLMMKQNSSWRTAYPSGSWFSNRGTGNGTCSLTVNDADPGDNSLSDNATDPVKMLGIGYSGSAEQRVEAIVDTHAQPLSCLRSSAAIADVTTLSNCVLRATNSGLITSNTISSATSTVYGKVKATSVTGTTYSGTTTTITAANLPQMPDWSTIFTTYRATGTEITVASLPTRSPNLARNVTFNSAQSQWYESYPSGTSTATFSGPVGFSGHTACLYVDRSSRRAGAANLLAGGLLKPNTTYQISVDIHPNLAAIPVQVSNYFKVFMVLQYADGSTYESSGNTTMLSLVNGWTTLTATVTTPNWATHPTAAYAIVNSDNASGNSHDFYIDNIDFYESGGRFISQLALGPNVNPFGTANASGVYWINAGGNKLVITRSRIKGTLILSNLGAGSCIDYGPINMATNVVGRPVLMVEGDFLVRATNRVLSEAENSNTYDSDLTNYNPANMPYDFGSSSVSTTNTSSTDSYPSEIQGLIAVSGDLTFQNNTLVRGQILVGDDFSATSGALEVQYRYDSLLNPPTGFTADSVYVRRASAVRKMVAP